MNPENLIKELSSLLGLLKTLVNENFNFEISFSSPLAPFIDVAVESLVLLSKKLLDECTLMGTLNPEVIFSDEVQDVLGNPQQTSFKQLNVKIVEPEFSAFCLRIAEHLVYFKSYLGVQTGTEREISPLRALWHLEREALDRYLRHSQRIISKRMRRKVKKRNEHFNNIRINRVKQSYKTRKSTKR